jgi:predicted nucleic acid-binding protein
VRRSKLLPRVFGVIGTDQELLVAASSLVVRHRLQFWDAVILKASARGGADLLLSEDMQDGALLDGVQIVNPLDMANRATLDRLLPR